MRQKMDELFGGERETALDSALDLFDRMLPAVPLQPAKVKNVEILFGPLEAGGVNTLSTNRFSDRSRVLLLLLWLAGLIAVILGSLFSWSAAWVGFGVMCVVVLTFQIEKRLARRRAR